MARLALERVWSEPEKQADVLEGLAEGIIIAIHMSWLPFICRHMGFVAWHPPSPGAEPMAPAEPVLRTANPRPETSDSAQAAKLLGDVSVPSYYPALFASVADLLETFGGMVFERIRSRAEESGEEPAPPAQGEAREAVM